MTRNWICAVILLLFFAPVAGQRTYQDNSVLATGTWYKIAVKDPGIYKIDVNFLHSLGIGGSLASSSIRLFGNGGQLLPENCSGFKWDDLRENAIDMEDGGDGLFSGTDYFLFYAPGPDAWLKDSVHQQFTHQKNIYSDQSFYYLMIGGQGKTIPTISTAYAPNVNIITYDFHSFHELDTVNFLSSGKDWYGEEFTSAPGKQTIWHFSVSVPDADVSSPLTIVSSTMARSIGTGSNFTIAANGLQVMEQDIPPVGSGSYDQFGKAVQSAASFPITQSVQTIDYNFIPGSFNAQGWLNWFEITGRANLSMASVSQLPFRDWKTVGSGNAGSFTISNTIAGTQVWDITDPQLPVRIQGLQNGANYSFVNDCRVLHEYIAFNNSPFQYTGCYRQDCEPEPAPACRRGPAIGNPSFIIDTGAVTRAFSPAK